MREIRIDSLVANQTYINASVLDAEERIPDAEDERMECCSMMKRIDVPIGRRESEGPVRERSHEAWYWRRTVALGVTMMRLMSFTDTSPDRLLARRPRYMYQFIADR